MAADGLTLRPTLLQVMWTPEEEDDYFTQEDLASDYPLLNTL